MRTLKRLLISSVALMVLVGCGADTSSPITACSVSPTPECFAGSYVLVSVNGQALPAFTIPGQEQWTASTLNVKANGTMSGTITWKEYKKWLGRRFRNGQLQRYVLGVRLVNPDSSRG
jgi:hypothetical protein